MSTSANLPTLAVVQSDEGQVYLSILATIAKQERIRLSTPFHKYAYVLLGSVGGSLMRF